MKNLSLTTVGAVCALLTVVCFVVGIALMAGSGVQVLIPETGQDALDWIADVDEAGGAFFVGAWLVSSRWVLRHRRPDRVLRRAQERGAGSAARARPRRRRA